MQIVIDIDEDLYKGIERRDGALETEYVCDELMKAVDNCTPLPKGHGRLMILSENRLKENQINLDWSCQKWISEVGLSNATVKIIKADKVE